MKNEMSNKKWKEWNGIRTDMNWKWLNTNIHSRNGCKKKTDWNQFKWLISVKKDIGKKDEGNDMI